MTRPAPPACAIPKVNAQQWKKLRTPAAGPISGLPSGAYGIGPLMTRLTPTDASSGTREIGRAHVWNSSHLVISYAVFCLKKKKNKRKYLVLIHLTDAPT